MIDIPTKKKGPKALFCFLMQGFFLATSAVLHFLHLMGMSAFIAGRDVVLLATDAALQDDVIAF